MNSTNLLRVAALSALVLGLAGCIGIGGSDRTYVHRPTIGQQLTDLKTARDQGAITPAEYDRLKAEMLARPAHGGN